MGDYREALSQWLPLGDPPPADLRDTRLELHHAVQPIAAAAITHAEKQPDDGHTALEWEPEAGAFVGVALPGGVRVALSVGEMVLSVRAPNGEPVGVFTLVERKLPDALEWLRRTLNGASAGAIPDIPLAMPTYDLPDHPVARGARFLANDRRARVELARWVTNSHALLSVLARRTLGASPVRCWPHHFDLAVLVGLDPPGGDPELARSIGVGLSPGDAGDESPYLYCNPWPRPDGNGGGNPGVLPDLPSGGRWHTEGWFGAVLPAEAVVACAADEQADRALAFLRYGMAAGRVMLDAL